VDSGHLQLPSALSAGLPEAAVGAGFSESSWWRPCTQGGVVEHSNSDSQAAAAESWWRPSGFVRFALFHGSSSECAAAVLLSNARNRQSSRHSSGASTIRCAAEAARCRCRRWRVDPPFAAYQSLIGVREAADVPFQGALARGQTNSTRSRSASGSRNAGCRPGRREQNSPPGATMGHSCVGGHRSPLRCGERRHIVNSARAGTLHHVRPKGPGRGWSCSDPNGPPPRPPASPGCRLKSHQLSASRWAPVRSER